MKFKKSRKIRQNGTSGKLIIGGRIRKNSFSSHSRDSNINSIVQNVIVRELRKLHTSSGREFGKDLFNINTNTIANSRSNIRSYDREYYINENVTMNNSSLKRKSIRAIYGIGSGILINNTKNNNSYDEFGMSLRQSGAAFFKSIMNELWK